jgi:hypothetical protein
MARLRHANGHQECPFIGEDQKQRTQGQNGANDPEQTIRSHYQLTYVLPNNIYRGGALWVQGQVVRMGSVGRICLVAIGLPLFGSQAGIALEASALLAPSASSAAKANQPVACPSQDFSAFLRSFSESAKLQKAFTRLPLVYGQVDQELVGTGKPDFSTRSIGRFQEVPLFDKADGGRILPSTAKLAKNGLKVEVVTEVRESPSEKIAKLYAPDAGFHIFFKFRKVATCWFLFEIDDKSV